MIALFTADRDRFDFLFFQVTLQNRLRIDLTTELLLLSVLRKRIYFFRALLPEKKLV